MIIMAMLTKPRGVREVQRQLRPILAPSVQELWLSISNGHDIILDKLDLLPQSIRFWSRSEDCPS